MYERERKAAENPRRTSRITGQNMFILISLMVVWCVLYLYHENVTIFIVGMLVICLIAWRLDRRLW